MHFLSTPLLLLLSTITLTLAIPAAQEEAKPPIKVIDPIIIDDPGIPSGPLCRCIPPWPCPKAWPASCHCEVDYRKHCAELCGQKWNDKKERAKCYLVRPSFVRPTIGPVKPTIGPVKPPVETIGPVKPLPVEVTVQ